MEWQQWPEARLGNVRAFLRGRYKQCPWEKLYVHLRRGIDAAVRTTTAGVAEVQTHAVGN